MLSHFTPVMIIGGGRVGAAFAYNLRKAHFKINTIIEINSRRRKNLATYFADISISEKINPRELTEAKVVLICVQDDRIKTVGNQILKTDADLSGKLIAHTSGALSSLQLQPLKEEGALIGCLHPITAVPDLPPEEIDYSGIYFDVEGEPPAVEKLSDIIHMMGGYAIPISPEQKPAFHLAAVLYSNFFVILSHVAQESLKKTGVEVESLWKPFKPLVEATLANLDKFIPENALTGPLKRGDTETIGEHLRLLRTHFPEALPIYITLAEYALRHLSLPRETTDAIRKLLDEFR